MSLSEPFAVAMPDRTSPRLDARFLGQDQVYWRILLRGSVLLAITLGIYRFWLATDLRRFLWSNTEIDGNALEYNGSAAELLLGFVIAIGLLVPIYTILFVTALDLGSTGGLIAGASMLVLVFLSQYAIFRARRYRLTRTVYRGLRFHQTGSSWRYAICAVWWWSLTIFTLGLAYPFARASLERFKMGHTFYGDLPGRFEASAIRLLLRGLPMWLAIVMPVVTALSALSTIDWESASRELGKSQPMSDTFYEAVGLAAISLVLALAFALVLFPAFQAMVMRWWASGLRFGTVTAVSNLRTWAVYRAYLRFVGYLLIFAIVMGVGLLIAFGIIGFTFGSSLQSVTAEVSITLLMVGSYVVAALALSAIYQATAKLALWRLTTDSLELSGTGMLQQVRASGEPSSAIGEGLADALYVGRL